MSAKLRYDLTHLWPSEIGDQLYCEYKVHLRRTHPEVRLELPSLEQGEENHAALASQAAPVTREEIERSIREGKKLALCEWTLEGLFRDVLIRGRPDFFAFEGTSARLTLDFKFSTADRPFRSQEVQALVYAFLAESMGFEASELCYGIVLFPRSFRAATPDEGARAKDEKLGALQADGTLGAIYERCEAARRSLVTTRLQRTVVDGDRWKAFLYRYDRGQAEKDLGWALDFWLAAREPIPEMQYPRKCVACPFNAAGLCEHALQSADPRFLVRRTPEGTLVIVRRPA
ncbi:MAG: hypothetical protein HYS12_16780 [Planctomycetes bacterium]|nr:hypothetical protein [Planctomycetota bacterium]